MAGRTGLSDPGQRAPTAADRRADRGQQRGTRTPGVRAEGGRRRHPGPRRPAWPRGESKEKAAIDKWLKDITPSNELRDWYHQDRTATRYDAFVERYRAELADPAHTAAVGELVELVRAGGPVTLVTAVKDVPHSHVPVIVDQLEHELRHH